MEKLTGEKPVRIFTDRTLAEVTGMVAGNPHKEYLVTSKNNDVIWGVLNVQNVLCALHNKEDSSRDIGSLLYYYNREPDVVKVSEPYEVVENRAIKAAKDYHSLFINKTGIPRSGFKDFVSEIKWTEVLNLLAKRIIENGKKV
jgi:hypothetical protein